MKLSLIALGASAGSLLLAGSAMAGPCATQIEMLEKQMDRSAPTVGSGIGPSQMNQRTGESAATRIGPSSTAPQTPAEPAGNINQTGNTVTPTVTSRTGNAEAEAALNRARALDDAGDPACIREVNRAQNALM